MKYSVIYSKNGVAIQANFDELEDAQSFARLRDNSWIHENLIENGDSSYCPTSGYYSGSVRTIKPTKTLE